MRKMISRFLQGVFIKKALLFLLHIQNILGTLIIFSSPLPVRPKTSIGMLTGTSIIMLLLLFIQYKNKKIRTTVVLSADWLIVGFVAINALSLLGSPRVFDSTTFRLLLSAVVQYITLRLLPLSSKEKRMTIAVIGTTTLLVAAISVFQVVFRNQAIVLAKKYLFGDAAFSLSWDLERGRAPQWGNIVVSFPLWILSLLLFKSEKKQIFRLYALCGLILIPLSFVVSNFRWLTFCFFIGLTVFIVPLVRHKILSLSVVKKAGAALFGIFLIGVLLASTVFHYNLIDRLLLKEKQRDVVFTLGRSFLYQQAFSAFLSSPFVGIGTGNYRHIVERPVILHFYDATNQTGDSSVVETDREPVSSHNELLTVLAETGALGLGFFILLGYVVVSHLFFVVRTKPVLGKTNKLVYSVAFLVSILMYFLIGLFENLTPNALVLLFFVYAASLSWFPTNKRILKRT